MTSAEQELIRKYFAPLSGDGGAGLLDDAAIWSPGAGMDGVISSDTLIEGIHFIGDEPPDLIARKGLRVNISDIAAKGANIRGYLLNLVLPHSTSVNWLESFCAGLASDQEQFGCVLLGGDTVSSDGPLTISITALGETPTGKIVRRGLASPGDIVYVTGTIGDSAIGLDVLQGKYQSIDDEYLVSRYRLPRPRTCCVELVREFATAAMDVSDGLIGDLEQLAFASGVGARINPDLVPLSEPVRQLSSLDGQVRVRALTGGDDYEILFCISSERADEFNNTACEVEVQRIGEITDSGRLVVQDTEGKTMTFPQASWSHFS